jgi:glycine cleavage system regulatory protein
MHADKLITFIADDRPGLVERLSEVVIAHGGNWLESRMSQLAGKFAGIVRVSLPPPRVAEFERALAELEEIGLTLRLEGAPGAGPHAASAPWLLEIIGHDRPGIVHEFAAALAGRGINVLDMRTDIATAPMSAGPLFSAEAEIDVPARLDIDELREALESIADELTIEYTLRPAAR